MFADKFNLTLEQNRFWRKNIVEVIHSMSRLENVNTTFPQSKTMIDGMSVSGISTHDMQVLLNLKMRGNLFYHRTVNLTWHLRAKSMVLWHTMKVWRGAS